jgi:F-type H+-transporting ATPase subunit a
MEEVFPRVVFSIAGIPVRNTVISTWITMLLIVLGAWAAQRRAPAFVEMLIDFLRVTISDVMGGIDPDPYVPFLGSLIIFLLFANNIGIVPLVDTPTTDINAPAALAIIVFVSVYVFGIRQKGLFGYVKELLTPLFVLDLIGDVSRTLSMSLRLFGNIIATEIIVAVIYRLVKPLVPLPMIGLGMVTGVLQAYLFMILATSAISSAVQPRNPK